MRRNMAALGWQARRIRRLRRELPSRHQTSAGLRKERDREAEAHRDLVLTRIARHACRSPGPGRLRSARRAFSSSSTALYDFSRDPRYRASPSLKRRAMLGIIAAYDRLGGANHRGNRLWSPPTSLMLRCPPEAGPRSTHDGVSRAFWMILRGPLRGHLRMRELM